MTIEGLWALLDKENTVQDKCITDIRGHTLAVDLGSWLVKGTLSWDHPTSQILLVYRRLRHLLLMGANVLGVLDSKQAPVGKINRSGSKPGWRHYDPRIPDVFRAMGCHCVQANGEAESLCAALQQQNVVTAVLTHDADVLAYGATRLYHIRTTTSTSCTRVDAPWPQKTFAAVALLSGSDFSHKGVKLMGPRKTMKLVADMEKDTPEWDFEDLKARVPQLCAGQGKRFESVWEQYTTVVTLRSLPQPPPRVWQPVDEAKLIKLLPQKALRTKHDMRALYIERRFRDLPCPVHDVIRPLRVIKSNNPVVRVLLRIFPLAIGTDASGKEEYHYELVVHHVLLKGTAEGQRLLRALEPAHLRSQPRITEFFKKSAKKRDVSDSRSAPSQDTNANNHSATSPDNTPKKTHKCSQECALPLRIWERTTFYSASSAASASVADVSNSRSPSRRKWKIEVENGAGSTSLRTNPRTKNRRRAAEEITMKASDNSIERKSSRRKSPMEISERRHIALIDDECEWGASASMPSLARSSSASSIHPTQHMPGNENGIRVASKNADAKPVLRPIAMPDGTPHRIIDLDDRPENFHRGKTKIRVEAKYGDPKTILNPNARSDSTPHRIIDLDDLQENFDHGREKIRVATDNGDAETFLSPNTVSHATPTRIIDLDDQQKNSDGDREKIRLATDNGDAETLFNPNAWPDTVPRRIIDSDDRQENSGRGREKRRVATDNGDAETLLGPNTQSDAAPTRIIDLDDRQENSGRNREKIRVATDNGDAETLLSPNTQSDAAPTRIIDLDDRQENSGCGREKRRVATDNGDAETLLSPNTQSDAAPQEIIDLDDRQENIDRRRVGPERSSDAIFADLDLPRGMHRHAEKSAPSWLSLPSTKRRRLAVDRGKKIAD